VRQRTKGHGQRIARKLFADGEFSPSLARFENLRIQRLFLIRSRLGNPCIVGCDYTTGYSAARLARMAPPVCRNSKAGVEAHLVERTAWHVRLSASKDLVRDTFKLGAIRSS
jgi:hypothetical protein